MDGLTTPSQITAPVLTQLIKVRRADKKLKAERQRLQDFLRVNYVSDQTGLDPLEIFPLVVWESSLKYVTKPRDLLHVYRTCLLFHDILEPRKIGDIYFPLALEIDTFRSQFRLGSNASHSQVPLCSLRQVSRSLRTAVDLGRQRAVDAEIKQDFPYLKNHDGALKLIVNEYVDETELNLVRSMKYSYPTSGGLKRLSTLIIDIELNQEDIGSLELYSDALNGLLDSVGGQVLGFTFRDFRYWEPEPAYVSLHSWLCLMPNLRHLSLEFGTPKRVPNELHGTPFPHLKYLEDLHITFFTEYWELDGDPEEPLLVEAILSQNLHAKRLNLDTAHVEAHNDVLEELVNRPLFRDLIKSMVLEEIEVRSIAEEFETLLPLLSPDWRLKKIELCLMHVCPSQETLFHFLEQYEGLEEVSLWLSEVECGSALRFLRLPKLSRLKLYYLRAARNLPSLSIDYLIPCGSLKQLCLQHYVQEEECLKHFPKGREIVQFQGGWADLEKSNVWMIFPYLKQVRVVVGWGSSARKHIAKRP